MIVFSGQVGEGQWPKKNQKVWNLYVQEVGEKLTKQNHKHKHKVSLPYSDLNSTLSSEFKSPMERILDWIICGAKFPISMAVYIQLDVEAG